MIELTASKGMSSCWQAVIGMFLLSQTRSPRMALDAQLLVDKGGVRILGLSQSQRIESEIGIKRRSIVVHGSP